MGTAQRLEELFANVNETFTKFDEGGLTAVEADLAGTEACLTFLRLGALVEVAAYAFGIDPRTWDSEKLTDVAATMKLLLTQKAL